jgi:hypothetical protein
MEVFLFSSATAIVPRPGVHAWAIDFIWPTDQGGAHPGAAFAFQQKEFRP